MPEYRLNIETPPVQARPTVVTVVCGETEADMRQVLTDRASGNRYVVVGEWLPTQEWRAPSSTKENGFISAPSLPYDDMLALVKEHVQLSETQRLIREAIYAIERKES